MGPSEPQLVLIINEVYSEAYALSVALERRGYASFIAQTIEEAFAARKAQPFDAVIMTVGMGDMDGITLLRKFMIKFRNDVVIMLGTPSELKPLFRTQAEELGARGFLRRPLYPPELARILENAVARPQAPEDEAADEVQEGDVSEECEECEERNSSILVVDDDEPMRAAIVRALKGRGHDVAGVRDGREAVRCLPAFRCDLMVLDIIMPEMDGIEVLRWVRSHYPDLIVVVLSAMGQEGGFVAETATALGAAVVLRKPIHLDDLWRAVETALAAKPARQRGSSLAR